ncbi:MAG: hypothetical protein PHV02_19560 [Rhodocyclaceae bacterium]|nr:hypothetical protein [Rhodocyclaceae bacterium]
MAQSRAYRMTMGQIFFLSVIILWSASLFAVEVTMTPSEDQAVTAGNSANFSCSTSGAQGEVTYSWSFQNGSPSNSTSQNPGAVTFGQTAAGSVNECKVTVTDTKDGTVCGTASASTKVYVPAVTLKVEEDITECMEGRDVTYTGTATGTGSGLKYFTFTYSNPDGTTTTDTDWSLDDVEDNTRTMPDVPDGDTDHKYSATATVKLEYKGATANSSTISVSVYELWVEYFRDAATGKDWQVVVGENIAYKAIASSDCTNWQWDMQDGVPDAWNPTGGQAKQGSDMKIPYSDQERAGPGWFGDAYGTVDVYCEDGDGNSHHFYSTSMNPSRKAKVFFDPNLNAKGEAPSQAMPPCWYLFWKNGAVPDLDSFEYKHMNAYGESQVVQGFFWDTHVLRVGIPAGGTHYPGGMLINGTEFGGATGIDCCAEVVKHEMKHNVYAVMINSGAADNDPPTAVDNFRGDWLSDSEEPTFRCSILNKDTFNLAGIKSPVYSGYGDNEYAVMVHARGTKGVVAKDWSKGGKQW